MQSLRRWKGAFAMQAFKVDLNECFWNYQKKHFEPWQGILD